MSFKMSNGVSNFPQICAEKSYYVDKTGFLETFLQNHFQVSLFLRPRRFGKSLHMSMLDSFFDCTRHDGENLLYMVCLEREAGEGRLDILVKSAFDKSLAMVLEIKKAHKTGKLAEAVEQALGQIEQNSYDFGLRAEGYKSIVHWGIAFSGKHCLAGVRESAD